MPRIGVITGLKSEIAALTPAWPGDGFAYFASGGGHERAEAAARRMAADGAKLLMSVGLAGGLDAALRCGDVILATAVIAPNRRVFITDAGWCDRLIGPLQAKGQVFEAAVAGSESAVASAADKAELIRETGALAVDMESHGVARAAAELNIPFVILRVVADPAGRAVPSAAIAGMGASGATRPLAVLARLLIKPWEIPAVAQLARDSRTGHEALGRVALALAGVLRG